MRFVVSILSTFLFSTTCFAGSVSIDVTLSPAGSFTAKTEKVSGQALMKKKGSDELVMAKGVTIDVNSITTGISLRDSHLKKRLEADKFPTAKLLKAQGKNGKGMALIEVKGKKLKVNGTYSIKGDNVIAQFPMKLTDLAITDVRYMGVGVKDTVTVKVEVPVAKPSAMRAPASK